MKKKYRKIYKEENLLGNKVDILNRVNFINNYSKEIHSLASTSILKNDNIYDYQQEWIYNKPIKDNSKNSLMNKLGQLAEDLSKMSDLEFVHGDINMKNILFNGDRFYVIDLEPSLFQYKKGNKQLMMTIPYWSFNDIQNNTISVESDKIGFFCFCCRILNEEFFIENTIELTRKRQEEYVEFLPLKEEDLINMSYTALLKESKEIYRS